ALDVSHAAPRETSSAATHPTPAGSSAEAWFEPMPQDLAPMQCGRPDCPTILEVNGGGVALFDADDDGDMDLALVIPGPYPAANVASGGTSRLYRNEGGRLVDATAGSGLDVEGYCNGVAVGDYDGDGRRDLYLTRRGTAVLLRNAGGGRFERVPEAAGAAGAPGDWGTSATFLDLDRDGDADLFVARYLDFDPDHPPMNGEDGRSCLWKNMPVMCGPQGLPAQTVRYYRNEGGRFVDATAEAGFGAPAAYGLGVIEGDWNADGWSDVFVANDSVPNHLFLSRGGGLVAEAGVLSGAALSAQGRELAGMGVTSGDADGDADEELFMTSFSMEASAYYVNEGGGRFRD
ncbi:MAG TPA: VCBS repeat-containing protein, partial [Planctomycetota bacterium]|nr:VCBS repeat-containing protein [Planctomycetota bacterium]